MKRFKKSCKLMGCAFELGVISDNESEALHYLEMGIEEIRRIEFLLSEFKEVSQIHEINRNAGINFVTVDTEVLSLIERCQVISKTTKGYFDISVGPLKKLYNFKNGSYAIPDKSAIKNTLKKVGYSKISINQQYSQVRLNVAEMHISMAAIGKGYAADQVRQLWKESNIPGGYINASGDLTAFGQDENGDPWKIGIANPDNKNKMLFNIPLYNASMATSGDYEQYFIHKNRRFSHNINPKTGLPVEGIKSVSIFSPSAELSDALATAVSAMGIDKGISFLNQMPNTHGIMIDNQNQVFFTKKLNYEKAVV